MAVRHVQCCLIVILAIGTGCRPEEQPATAVRARLDAPNVVLISIDTLRADHVRCYGYDRHTSPNIDQIAAEGALFEQAISSTSWTLPAHAAMFTGLADTVHGCTDTSRHLADDRYTLAERLKDAGYTTAGFFSGPYLHPVFGLGQGHDTYVDCTSYAEMNDRKARTEGKIEGMDVWKVSQHDITSPRVYARVSEWLKGNRARPFYLFIHMWDVHFDFVPPPPYDTMFDPDYTGTITGENFFFNPAVRADMPKRDLEHLIALYDGEIAWTDHHVGKILAVLDALGLTDQTLVVLTADHGTAFFEHGRRGHRNDLYDNLIHIPLIMRWPGHIPAGKRYGDQVRLIDILPTVLDLVHAPLTDELMGQTLAPLFSGGKLARNEPAVSELFTMGQTLRSFRRPDRKLIFDVRTHRGAVFDLMTDPGEQSQVITRDSPLVEKALADRQWALAWLERYRKAMPETKRTEEIPDELLQQLEALGYLEDPRETARTQPVDTSGEP